MQGNKKQTSSILGGDTGWISLRIGCGESVANPDGLESDRERDAGQEEIAPLFALAEAPLPERYPRLTFLAISLVLLISALTAEFEYLRGAGYYWP